MGTQKLLYSDELALEESKESEESGNKKTKKKKKKKKVQKRIPVFKNLATAEVIPKDENEDSSEIQIIPVDNSKISESLVDPYHNESE